MEFTSAQHDRARGGLLGAAYGASAVPAGWRSVLHGWPGWRADDLTRVASVIVGTQ